MLIPEFYLLLAKVIIVSLSFLLMIGVRTVLMLLIFILSLIWLPHPEFMVLVLGFCGFLLLNFSGTVTSLRFITYSLYSNFDNNEKIYKNYSFSYYSLIIVVFLANIIAFCM